VGQVEIIAGIMAEHRFRRGNGLSGGRAWEGDCLAAELRPDNVHSADDWDELLLPEGPEGARREVCHPHPGKRQPGAEHRGTAGPSDGVPKPQAGGPVQEFPVPGGELEDSAAHGSHGGVSFRGVVVQQVGNGGSNEVRLWLGVLAYNLGNLWRRLVLPRKIENWTPTSLQRRLVKAGGRLVNHARYCQSTSTSGTPKLSGPTTNRDKEE
jgi:hypothetical protein